MSEPAEPLPQSEAPVEAESSPDEISILTDLFGGKMNTEQFKHVLEAALLTTTEPLPVAELKKLSDVSLEIARWKRCSKNSRRIGRGAAWN